VREERSMSNSETDDVPSCLEPLPTFARLRGVAGVAIAVGLLAWNDHMAREEGHYFPKAVFMGAALLPYALGGVVEPRVMLAFERKYGLPSHFKAIGGVLIAIGCALGAYLAFGYYG
jgi:hypothetical protein